MLIAGRVRRIDLLRRTPPVFGDDLIPVYVRRSRCAATSTADRREQPGSACVLAPDHLSC
jgi:hypothetical protein